MFKNPKVKILLSCVLALGVFACTAPTTTKISSDEELSSVDRATPKVDAKALEGIEKELEDLNILKTKLSKATGITLPKDSNLGSNFPSNAFSGNRSFFEVLKSEQELSKLAAQYVKKIYDGNKTGEPSVKYKKIKEVGFPLRSLIYGGFSLPWIRDCGYSEQELKTELKNLKYLDFFGGVESISNYKDKYIEMVYANKTPDGMKSAGYSLNEIKESGLYFYNGVLQGIAASNVMELGTKSIQLGDTYKKAGYKYIDFIEANLINKQGMKFKEDEMVGIFDKLSIESRIKLIYDNLQVETPRYYDFLESIIANAISTNKILSLKEIIKIRVAPTVNDTTKFESLPEYKTLYKNTLNAVLINMLLNKSSGVEGEPILKNLDAKTNIIEAILKIKPDFLKNSFSLEDIDTEKSFNLLALKKGNLLPKNFFKMGLSGKATREAGFSISDIVKATNFYASDAKEAGYSMQEILEQYKLTLTKLYKGSTNGVPALFTEAEVKSANYTLKDLRKISIRNNVTLKDLKDDLSFIQDKSLKAFKEAGFPALQIKELGLFKDTEIKAEGFPKDQLEQASIK